MRQHPIAANHQMEDTEVVAPFKRLNNRGSRNDFWFDEPGVRVARHDDINVGKGWCQAAIVFQTEMREGDDYIGVLSQLGGQNFGDVNGITELQSFNTMGMG